MILQSAYIFTAKSNTDMEFLLYRLVRAKRCDLEG